MKHLLFQDSFPRIDSINPQPAIQIPLSKVVISTVDRNFRHTTRIVNACQLFDVYPVVIGLLEKGGHVPE